MRNQKDRIIFYLFMTSLHKKVVGQRVNNFHQINLIYIKSTAFNVWDKPMKENGFKRKVAQFWSINAAK